MSANNNREAEPRTQREWAENQYGEPIKSLRDEYAMAALTGLCAYPHREGEGNKPEHFAKWCYALADAMLAERGAVKP